MLSVKQTVLGLIKTVFLLRFRYFLALRFLFVAILTIGAVERLLDLEFIRLTSSAHAQIFPTWLSPVIGFLYSNALFFPGFLLVFVAFLLLYGLGLCGRWILALVGSFEFIYQHLSAGNIYGHEGFVHQFFWLFLIYEFALGRQIIFVSPQSAPRRAFWCSLTAGLTVLLLRWQFAVVYLSAGLSKIWSPLWKQPDFLFSVFSRQIYTFSKYPSLLSFLESFFSLAQLTIPWLQIFFPVLLLFSKTRKFALAFSLIFHLTLAVLMQIYWFSFFMIGLTLLFYSERKKSQNSPSAPSI